MEDNKKTLDTGGLRETLSKIKNTIFEEKVVPEIKKILDKQIEESEKEKEKENANENEKEEETDNPDDGQEQTQETADE